MDDRFTGGKLLVGSIPLLFDYKGLSLNVITRLGGGGKPIGDILWHGGWGYAKKWHGDFYMWGGVWVSNPVIFSDLGRGWDYDIVNMITISHPDGS